SGSTLPSAPTSRPSPDGGGPSPAPQRPSPPACGWSAPPTTSAGHTIAGANSRPTTLLASGSFAPQPWRPGSPITAGPWMSSSAFRSPYPVGSHPDDAAIRPYARLSERRHDHASVGSYRRVCRREYSAVVADAGP